MSTDTAVNDVVTKETLPLAKRRWRLVAVILDGILGILVALPVMMYFKVWETVQAGSQPSLLVLAILFLWGISCCIAMNYWLLEHRGQTIGKWCVGVAIIGVDEKRKSALHLLTRRYLPLWIVAQIPLIGNLLTTIDSLFIFRKDKRCIHDRIADTKVVSVKS